jgi:lipoprotein signal peptidase
MKFKTLFGYTILGGVFLLFDRVLKWFATSIWNKEHLLYKYFGWDPFLNRGVAFSIQIPRSVVVTLTAVILVAVVYFFTMNRKANGKADPKISLGMVLILSGGFSNLFDRLVFNYTIDYIRVLNGVINFADIFIVLGFVLYFSGLNQDTPKT